MPAPTTSQPNALGQTSTPATSRGYFNAAQIEDIGIAEDLIPAARDTAHQARLALRDITEAYIAGLEGFIGQARAKMAATGQANDGQQPAALNADGAERNLLTALQGIQSAAKQRERMEQEDDDPDTNFKAEGYLIGRRLNPKRATLLQNADTLLGKVRTDHLPGYKTPQSITDIEKVIADYKAATATQKEKDEESEQDRIARDALIKKINARRMAIQHAADALWPYTDPNHRPTRKRFKLPLDRPFNG